MTPQELKNSILQRAIEGKLVEQRAEEGSGEELYEVIQAKKKKLIKEGKIKKQKVLPEITDEEIPFEIPESWKWVRLGEVILVEMGQSPKGSAVNSGPEGIEFHQGKVMFSDKFIMESDKKTTQPTKIAEVNSILLCVRAPVGKVNISPRRICIGRGLCALNPINLNLEFAYYLLVQQENSFIKQSTGTTFKAISREIVSNQIIPLPPLNEQKRIVQKIEELMLLVEAYEESWKRLEELNKKFPEDMKKSLLQEAITGKLVEQRAEEGTSEELYKTIQAEKKKLIKEGQIKKQKALPEITEDEMPFNIPESWKWVRLGEIGEWGAGSTPSRSNPKFYGGKIPWLKTGDLNDSYITDVPEHITDLALNSTSLKLNPVNSVLIAMYGATIGKLGILKKPMTTNQACCACQPINGIYNLYLFYFLMASRRRLTKMAEGGAQPNISRTKIISVTMPLPPLNEQKRIVERLEELLPLCDQLMTKAE